MPKIKRIRARQALQTDRNRQGALQEAGTAPHPHKKNAKRKRRLRLPAILSKVEQKRVKRLLPNG